MNKQTAPTYPANGSNCSNCLHILLCFALFCLLNFSISNIALYASPQEHSTYEDENDSALPPDRPLHLPATSLYDGRIIAQYKVKIGLSPQQEDKITTLTIQNESAYIRTSSEIKVKEFQLATFLRNPNRKTNRQQMASLIREISRLKTDLILTHINYLLDVRDLLSPKQLNILKSVVLPSDPNEK